jgi:hypothetical protein
MAKTFTRMAAQGDFIIFRINEIPANVETVSSENGVYVVAHSETGHNHVMEAERVTAYKPTGVNEVDLYQMFFSVEAPTEINHLRSYDTHEVLIVPPGNYEIRRQREYVAEGFRRAAD